MECDPHSTTLRRSVGRNAYTVLEHFHTRNRTKSHRFLVGYQPFDCKTHGNRRGHIEHVFVNTCILLYDSCRVYLYLHYGRGEKTIFGAIVIVAMEQTNNVFSALCGTGTHNVIIIYSFVYLAKTCRVPCLRTPFLRKREP